ncbi:MAG TPA: hypothetical protein VD996_18015 [Chitinophagaceae bacterium]|nr:hypothetical protein [Chitinophagaceae bacterium]
MRILLLIPALLLFLSNIPFVHKMEMKKELAAQNKTGCCKKKQSMESKCKMDHPPKAKEKCSMQRESTCICICCFQFAAPDQFASRMQFGIDIPQLSLPEYYLQHWKNPLLSLPWQPPDPV